MSSRIQDVRVLVESPPDKLGRQSFTVLWTDAEGVFRPEPSKEDGLPVGLRRGQCFRAELEPYLLRFREEGLAYSLEDRCNVGS